MADFKDRLVEEHKQLRDKVDSLIEFLLDVENTEKVSDQSDWNDLCVQRDIMIAYLGILENRMIKLNILPEEE